jgi:hypothetical protein
MHLRRLRVTSQSNPKIGKASYKRIATEEAWMMKDIFDRYMLR